MEERSLAVRLLLLWSNRRASVSIPPAVLAVLFSVVRVPSLLFCRVVGRVVQLARRRLGCHSATVCSVILQLDGWSGCFV